MGTARKLSRAASSNEGSVVGYTRDESGYFVRNSKPSSGVLNQKKIEENVRILIEDSHPEEEPARQ